MTTVKSKTIVVTGGLQGIGEAIIKRLMEDGDTQVVFLAKEKTDKTDSFLALARKSYQADARFFSADIRSEESINSAIEKVVDTFGGIDILLHAATVINTQQAHHIATAHYDLSCDINARSTFLLAKACYKHLAASENGHMLTIAPPINLDPKMLGAFTTYASSQYMRSMITVGLANHPDWQKAGISVNALWPLKPYKSGESVILYQGHTQQQENQKDISLIGEAAHLILSKPAGCYNGEFFYDEEMVEMGGVSMTEFGGEAPAAYDNYTPVRRQNRHHDEAGNSDRQYNRIGNAKKERNYNVDHEYDDAFI
jgi:citronellol/citronellal dehydrogenase